VPDTAGASVTGVTALLQRDPPMQRLHCHDALASRSSGHSIVEPLDRRHDDNRCRIDAVDVPDETDAGTIADRDAGTARGGH
jgi:hypothetical protein